MKSLSKTPETNPVHLENILFTKQSNESLYYTQKIALLMQRYEGKTEEKDESENWQRKAFIDMVDTANFLSNVVVPSLSGTKLKFYLNFEKEEATPVLVKNGNEVLLKDAIEKFLPKEISSKCVDCSKLDRNMEVFRQAMMVDNLVNIETNSGMEGKPSASEAIPLASNSCLENPFFLRMSLGYPVQRYSLMSLPLKEHLRNMWNVITTKSYEDGSIDLSKEDIQWYLDEFKKEEVSLFDFTLEHIDTIVNKEWFSKIVSSLDLTEDDFLKVKDSYLKNELYLYGHEKELFQIFKDKGFSVSKNELLKFSWMAKVDAVLPLMNLLDVSATNKNEKPLLFEFLDNNQLNLAIALVKQGVDLKVKYEGKTIQDYLVFPENELISFKEAQLRDELVALVQSQLEQKPSKKLKR